MDLSGSAFIAATAASAMARVFLICGVGYVLALYPKENPFFSQSIMKPLSRIANFVFVPCLIIYALGSGVTLDKVAAYGELIPGSLLIIGISYLIASTFGRILFEDDPHLFRVFVVAMGSPNVVAFPMLVMDSLCTNNEDVNADYDGNPEACFVEATSMLFVFCIPWFFVFWGYGFPTIQTLIDPSTGEEYLPGEVLVKEQEMRDAHGDQRDKGVIDMDTGNEGKGKGKGEGEGDLGHPSLLGRVMHSHACQVITRVLTSLPIVCTFIGITIGLITPLQNALFYDFGPLTPVGSALATLSQPVMSLNGMIMAASLASVNLTDTLFGAPDEEEEAKPSAEGEGGGQGSYVSPATASSSSSSETSTRPPSLSTHRNDGGEGAAVNGDKADASASSGVSGSVSGSGRTVRLRAVSVAEMEALSVGGDLTQGRGRSDSSSSNVAATGTGAGTGAGVYKALEASTGTDTGTGIGGVDAGTGASMRIVDSAACKEGTGTGTGTGTKGPGELKINMPHARSVAAFLICRLILPPVAMVPLVVYCMRAGIISNKMTALILCLESAAPCAQTLIVSMNQVGLRRAAGQLSVLYVIQYGACVVTVTLVATVALTLINP